MPMCVCVREFYKLYSNNLPTRVRNVLWKNNKSCYILILRSFLHNF